MEYDIKQQDSFIQKAMNYVSSIKDNYAEKIRNYQDRFELKYAGLARRLTSEKYIKDERPQKISLGDFSCLN